MCIRSRPLLVEIRKLPKPPNPCVSAMHLPSYLAPTLLAIGLSTAAPQPSVIKRSPEPKLEKGQYIVDRQARFSNKAVCTFTGLNTLPEGLYASNYPSSAFHSFVPSNVIVRNGYLQLVVKGRQTKLPYKCAEVATNIENIKYASVRTTAILSEPAGVCNGKFAQSEWR